jgi:NTE family protein
LKADFDRQQSDPGLRDIIDRIATIPMTNYSAATIRELKAAVQDIAKDEKTYADCMALLRAQCPTSSTPPPLFGPKMSVVHLTFDSLTDEKEREYFLSLPTTFQLPKDSVDKLRAVAAKLLDASSEFRLICRELKCISE